MNESVTVRSEERAIYTHSRNLAIQIYVGSSDADLGTFDLNRKHCSHRVKVRTSKSRSELPTNVKTFDVCRQPTSKTLGVRTFDGRRQPTSKTPGVGTPDLGWDFRLSGISTHVGSSNRHSHCAG